jgi:glucosyl-dolichyl phosphate glucuronosyltransferase
VNISVVITTYNRAPLLAFTLGQLARQQFVPGDEVIVVDNASTDETPEVIARAARNFPVPLHQFREEARGKSPALNAGIARARGDLLALTDDDVLVADDWIATMRTVFSDSSLVLVGGRVDPHWEGQAPAWLRVAENGHYGVMSSPLALLHYGEAQELGHRTAVGANMAVRRLAHDALGGFDPNLGRRHGTLLCGEDHDFCQRAVAAGYRCEYRPELRVRHWVPVERTRFAYYLRWFFWSGVTNALLERSAHNDVGRGHTPLVPRYLWRTLVASPVRAVTAALRGRLDDAATELVQGAFALGYIARRLQDRWQRPGHPHTTQSPTTSGAKG